MRPEGSAAPRSLDGSAAPRSLDGSAAPCARDDLLIRHIGDETVAWSPIASSPVHLPSGSAMLLQLLDGQVTTADLVADLGAVVELDQRAARKLLDNELTAFDEAGLLATSVEPLNHDRERDVFPAPPNP